MSFAPLFASGPLVTAHAFAALAALFLGMTQLIFQKGGHRHKTIGYVWCALMVLVAVSSFGIHDIRLFGPFSPIHLLSIVTLVALASAIFAARRGDIKSHRIAMRWLFFAALIGAGIFTLLPGRDMYLVVFGQ